MIIFDQDAVKKQWIELLQCLPKYVDTLMKVLTNYHKAGLSAAAIDESLRNIAIFYDMGAMISKANKYLPRIEKAIEKSKEYAQALYGNDVLTSLAGAHEPLLGLVREAKNQIAWLSENITDRDGSDKHPSLENLHRIESGLILYFINTGYCADEDAAIREVLSLYAFIGRIISKKSLKEVFKKFKNEAYDDLKYMLSMSDFIPKN